VRQPLLLQYYQLLPDQGAEDIAAETKAFRKGLGKFKKAVEARYNEGTLEKLLESPVVDARRAAVQALGLIGTIAVNAALAARLHDDDPTVRRLADEALWSLWFRADSAENNEELKRLTLLPHQQFTPEEMLARFNALIRKAPRFAEVYNQRAVFHFRLGNHAKAIADCEKALRLNPHHFGAASGMAQCFLKQKKFRAALRVYRRAARINPNLDGVQEAIESLERMLGEEGKR
jgi:tetratricopeptide (TPR) repeat protein